MEHHTPIIEETEKVFFLALALPIHTIEVLIHWWTISETHFLHSCTTIKCHDSISHYHSMDSSHHHPHSSPKLVAFFKAHKSPGSSNVLGCKEAARHRQQLCDYCTSAKHPHCPHLQSGTCHTCPQQDLICFD
jgi:hypothetical protein